MNRCPTRLRQRARKLSWLSAAVWIGLSSCHTIALAQDNIRPFPATAKPGYLEVTQPPQVLLDGRSARLSPGARIKDSRNLLVLSASLVGQRLPVQYTRDAYGLIHEVWLLSAAEVQRSTMPTLTNIVFGADANPPKIDDGQTPFHQLPTFPAQ